MKNNGVPFSNQYNVTRAVSLFYPLFPCSWGYSLSSNRRACGGALPLILTVPHSPACRQTDPGAAVRPGPPLGLQPEGPRRWRQPALFSKSHMCARAGARLVLTSAKRAGGPAGSRTKHLQTTTALRRLSNTSGL